MTYLDAPVAMFNAHVSPRSIADALSLPMGTVYSYLSKARAAGLIRGRTPFNGNPGARHCPRCGALGRNVRTCRNGDHS